MCLKTTNYKHQQKLQCTGQYLCQHSFMGQKSGPCIVTISNNIQSQMPPCLLALPGSPYAFDAILAQRQLHWVGHIIHMPDCCLLRQVLMESSFQPAQNPVCQGCSIKLPADSDIKKVQHPPERRQHQQINLFGAPYAKMVTPSNQWCKASKDLIMMTSS